MTTFEIPIIASSSVTAGATNITNNGSVFEILFQQPIIIPNNIRNCYVKVDESTVWWTIPNISVNLGNNLLYIEYNASNYIVTIPNGLYSVSDLNNTIDRELFNLTGVAGILSFEPDNATQKVELTINVATVQIDFTQSNTIRTVIGFDSKLVPDPNPTTGVYSVLGDNIAQFNTIEYFLLHSDVVDSGIRINDKYSQTIAQILIDVPPGSQIVSREYNPPKSDAMNIAGTVIDRIKFWLTDQDGILVDTNGEDFGCRLVIQYEI